MQHLGTTPGIWDDSNITSGNNANGTWNKLQSGLITQTGKVTLVNGAATVTFPIAFKTACNYMDLTPIVGGLALTTAVSAWLTAVPTLTSAQIAGRQITLLLLAGGAFDVMWYARGS